MFPMLMNFKFFGLEPMATILESHLTQLEVSFPFAYGLPLEQMQTLGLYISEPSIFVVNSESKIQVVDISNNPFVCPELQDLVNGLGWIRSPDNIYPARGMHK